MKKINYLSFFILILITLTNSNRLNAEIIILSSCNNQKDGFLKNEYKGDVVEIKEKRATIIFKNIDAGEYAVSFIHDENKNNKMDTNFFGIPKEDYGCSNNAKSFLGPPKYEDAKFMLSENKTMLIEL